MAKIAGPSNIGNYFAAHGIEATCGFGVTYENIHAPNERVKLDTIPMAYSVYAAAIVRVLAAYPLDGTDVYLHRSAAPRGASPWGYFLPLRAGAAPRDGSKDPFIVLQR